MEMKILQPNFGILVVLTKKELTKICNEPGIRKLSFTKSIFLADMAASLTRLVNLITFESTKDANAITSI